MRKVKNLEDVFPVWKIEHKSGYDCMLDKLGSLTIGFKVMLPEIFILSANDYEAMHSGWVRAIKVLPAGTILHKQDWFIEAKHHSEFERTDHTFLSHASELHFNERPFLEHESFLYLTMLVNGKPTADALSSSLIRGNLMSARSLNQKAIEFFLDSCGQFAKIVADTGYVGLKKLGAGDLSSTEENAGLIERYCYLLGKNDPRVIADVQLGEELKVGAKHCKVFSMSDAEILPSACGPRITYDKYSTDVTKSSIGFAAPLGLLLKGNHIYNQYLVVEDVPETLKRHEKRRLKFQSLSAYSRENSISRDTTNQYLNEAISLGRLTVKAHFNLICFSENEKVVKEMKNQVSAAMSQIDAGTKEETESAAQLYWAGIPGNAAGLPVHECFTTFAEQASCFFNAETNYASSVSPIGIRLADRVSGRPLHVDFIDEPMLRGICTNRNMFVLGPPGSGKSVFCNHFLRTGVEQDAHGVIIDVGHSYRGVCELLGGYYFTYSDTERVSLNPFRFEGEADTEKKESIKALLLALWKKDSEGFTRTEYVALSNALQGYFELKVDDPCFNSFYEYLKTGFAEQIKQDNVQQKDFDLSNFLYVLRPYYKAGEFDFLLNATENLDLLNQRLVVFELDAIKDHPILFPVVTLIIIELFISKMRRLKGVRKIILIEEAWKAIAKQGMAEYIKYLYKTLRKFYGIPIVVTQDLEDIINSEIVKEAIINTSDTKFLLDQSKYANRFDMVQQLLGLSDKDKALVLSLNRSNDPQYRYKEVFVSLGTSHSKVYRIELSLEEYLAYTTEQKEKLQVQEYAKQYGSMQQGIKMLARHIREQRMIA
jgi:conjugation system TraG family ATPase